MPGIDFKFGQRMCIDRLHIALGESHSSGDH